MIANLYIIVVVLVRLLAIGIVVGALYAFGGTVLVGLMFGSSASGFSWIPLAVAVVSGLVFWPLAKPIARVVTSDI